MLVSCLVCTGVAIAFAVAMVPVMSLLFALAAEILRRYLFFAAAVPKTVASTFLTPKEVAA